MKVTKILALILCIVLLSVCLVSCNDTPTIEISDDGYWVINGEKTNVKAEGADGKDGKDGTDGKNGVDGEDGIDGDDAVLENLQGLDFYLKDDGTYAVALGNAELLSKIDIPSTYKGKPVTSFKNKGFFDCPNLTSVVIPDSITSIGYRAFEKCSKLTSVTIGSGVTSIESYAFSNCGLTSIVIPDSVVTIDSMAFSYCQSLISINFTGTVEQWNAIVKGSDWNTWVPATKVTCVDGTASLQ